MSNSPATFSVTFGASENRAMLSLRMLKYFFTFLLVWQGSAVGGSIFEITGYLDPSGVLGPHEFYLIIISICVLIERSITGDYRIRRTYFDMPLGMIFLALFISWCRGAVIMQRFTLVWEAHEALLIPVSVMILGNAFRDEEDRVMAFRLILLGVLFKAADGIWIFFFSDAANKEWGVLQLWRDGYLLGLGVVSFMLFLHFAPERYAKLRRTVILTFPAVMFALLFSFRRTFIVGALVSAVAMLVTVGRGRRKRQGWIVAGTLCGFLVVIFATDPGAILTRLSGLLEPTEEGSTYIRMLEYPNVLQNIAHNPILGTAIGTQWHRYYRMPVSAVYTTLGCHNTYLYFPLRGGILATVGFFWLLLRLWKATLLNFRLRRSLEDEFQGQLSIQLLILYQAACFFGLMYGDAMSPLFGFIIIMIQLQCEHISGVRSYANVDFLSSWNTKQLVFRERRRLRLTKTAIPALEIAS